MQDKELIREKEKNKVLMETLAFYEERLKEISKELKEANASFDSVVNSSVKLFNMAIEAISQKEIMEANLDSLMTSKFNDKNEGEFRVDKGYVNRVNKFM